MVHTTPAGFYFGLKGFAVLTENERQWIQGEFDSLRSEQTKVLVEIATLKVKAGIWGLIGAAIPVCLLIVITMIRY